MTQRYATVTAIGLFSIIVFISVFSYGLTIFLAVLSTIVTTIIVGGMYLGLRQKLELLNSITGTILFAMGGVLLSVVFLPGTA